MLYGLTALFCIAVAVAVSLTVKYIWGKDTRQCTLCGDFRHRTAFSGNHRHFSNPPASWCNRCLRKYYRSFTPGTIIAPKKLLERRANHKWLLSYAGMSVIFLTFSVAISELSSENPFNQITAASAAFVVLLACFIIVLHTYAILVERNKAGDTSPILWALGATALSLTAVAIANLFLGILNTCWHKSKQGKIAPTKKGIPIDSLALLRLRQGRFLQCQHVLRMPISGGACLVVQPGLI